MGAGQNQQNVDTTALIDSGAGGSFIDQAYAKKIGVTFRPLSRPITAINVDGTKNKRGVITHYVKTPIKINGRIFNDRLFITGLGKQRIILGHSWLKDHDPDISWAKWTLQWRKTEQRQQLYQVTIEDEESDEWNHTRYALEDWVPSTFTVAHVDLITDFENEIKRMLGTHVKIPKDVIPERDLVISFIEGEMCEESQDIWINSSMNKSIEFEHKFGEKKEVKNIKDFVPPEYHEYLSVFDEKAAARFQNRDHGITKSI